MSAHPQIARRSYKALHRDTGIQKLNRRKKKDDEKAELERLRHSASERVGNKKREIARCGDKVGEGEMWEA